LAAQDRRPTAGRVTLTLVPTAEEEDMKARPIVPVDAIFRELAALRLPT
jgi:hypothetical protein